MNRTDALRALAVATLALNWQSTLIASAGSPASQLSRTNLLTFSDAQGHIRKVETRSDWLRRRSEIVGAMQHVMGPLPGSKKRCPLNVQTDQVFDAGSYVRIHLTYASEPGSRVPAYLLIPKSAVPDRALALSGKAAADQPQNDAAALFHSGRKRAPAVLALHSTDMEFGNRVLVEQLRTQYRAYALELVGRGYVVLAPAYPLMADYQPDLQALGYRSGTMKAIWDNLRGLDLLDSLPFVRHGRYGAIGHSLGGHNAIYTAVFDPRIRVVVSSCGFDSFVDYMNGHIEGWTSPRYMPALLNYRDRLQEIPFDFYELLGALAPRQVFINAPLGDTNFKSASVDRIVAAAELVYRLHGVPQNLRVVHPNCGHDFPTGTREEAYQVLDSVLK